MRTFIHAVVPVGLVFPVGFAVHAAPVAAPISLLIAR